MQFSDLAFSGNLVKRPDDGLKKQSYCNESRRLGDFSTLCFKASQAIYVTIFNPCDVPYSVTIVILQPHNNLEIIKKLTSSLTSTIPIKG